MGEKSSIEWTDATWNPWQGCTKVSPACTNCYMFRDMARYGKDGSIVVRSSPPTFNLPLRKDRSGTFKIPSGSKVFTCSWSDWFHQDADDWRDEAWEVIRQRPDLIFQIVTKRTERLYHCLPDDWDDGYPNVWLIATAENQQWLTKRITELAAIPCAVRGLSIEPLLGPITLDGWFGAIDWVIVGGESGPESRAIAIEWVRKIRNECTENQIPFFFKQWGEWIPVFQHAADGQIVNPDKANMGVKHIGKKHAGRFVDGVEWSEFPFHEFTIS